MIVEIPAAGTAGLFASLIGMRLAAPRSRELTLGPLATFGQLMAGGDGTS
jgi:hypothetical protein